MVKPAPSILSNQTGEQKRAERVDPNTLTWRAWLTSNFPQYVRGGFAPRHEQFWDWGWSIALGVRPAPFIAVWPRGGAKSTSAELLCVAVEERRARNYVLYVSETQDQADKHVASISGPMEEIGVERAVNKYGSSKGWRRERLVTSSGFVVDAIGLDTASRGIKFEERRPDLIILDDIDNRHDSKEVVEKKVETLTQTILPTGSEDCAVLFVQNVIHVRSIMARFIGRKADFLLDHVMSGPFKAIENFKYEFEEGLVKITGGIATWAGQSLQACANYIRTWGLRAFLRECQHQVGNTEGALWNYEIIEAQRVKELPGVVITRRAIALDPAVSSKDSSDEHGLVIGSCALIPTAKGTPVRHGFVEKDLTLRGLPNTWAVRGIAAYALYECNVFVGEVNNGGELIENTIRGISRESVKAELIIMGVEAERAEAIAISGRQVNYKKVSATQNKETRAEPVSSAYSEGRVHHVGVLADLEDEQCSWVPGRGRSPNRVDAVVWCMTELGVSKPTGVLIG